MKLGETVEITSYTPPSPMKATPTSAASDSNDVSTASVSEAGDRGGIDKNLRKNISSNINLKYESCRYVHAE